MSQLNAAGPVPVPGVTVRCADAVGTEQEARATYTTCLTAARGDPRAMCECYAGLAAVFDGLVQCGAKPQGAGADVGAVARRMGCRAPVLIGPQPVAQAQAEAEVAVEATQGEVEEQAEGEQAGCVAAEVREVARAAHAAFQQCMRSGARSPAARCQCSRMHLRMLGPVMHCGVVRRHAIASDLRTRATCGRADGQQARGLVAQQVRGLFAQQQQQEQDGSGFASRGPRAAWWPRRDRQQPQPQQPRWPVQQRFARPAAFGAAIECSQQTVDDILAPNSKCLLEAAGYKDRVCSCILIGAGSLLRPDLADCAVAQDTAESLRRQAVRLGCVRGPRPRPVPPVQEPAEGSA